MTSPFDRMIGVLLESVDGRLATPSGTLDLIVIVCIGLCAFALLISVLIDFIEFNDEKRMNGEKTKERKSVVATGTMLLFFLALYLVLRLGIGTFLIQDLRIRIPITILCIIIVLIGTAVNIKGRYDLGKNWANHIKIYDGHTLITTGMYRVVRHPLYASLIWIAFAASIAYQNWFGVILTAAIFLPMMAYRAKQEEKLLTERFKSYDAYAKTTPRFFPKIIPSSRRHS